MTTAGEASKVLEPPGKAPQVEAAAPSRSKSSSSFMKEFDKLLWEHEEDRGMSNTSSSALQLHEYFTEETIPATDELQLPLNTSVHPALMLKVNSCSAQSPPSWMKSETDSQLSEKNACILEQKPSTDA